MPAFALFGCSSDMIGADPYTSQMQNIYGQDYPNSAEEYDAVGDDNLASATMSMLRIADYTRRSGDIAGAIALGRRAVRFSPLNPLPFVFLGEVLAESGQSNPAREAFETALSLESDNIDALRGLGNVMIALGHYELAIEKLDKVVILAHNDPRGYNSLGVAYDRAGYTAEAHDILLAGLELAPDDLNLTNSYALSLSFSGAHDQAIAMLEGIAFGATGSSTYRQNLALAYGLAGRMDEAANVARLDMDEETVQRNIAYYATLRESELGKAAPRAVDVMVRQHMADGVMAHSRLVE